MTCDTAAEPCLWRCGEVSQVIDVTRARVRAKYVLISQHLHAPPSH